MIPDPLPPWSLDPRLAASTVEAGDLPLSRVLVSKNANYPWLILVPRRAHVSEIIDLDDAGLAQLTQEIRVAARALKDVTRCDKLNIAALGNIVPQLHVHIVARRKSDAAWPEPVWGHAPPSPYDDAKLGDFIASVKQKIGLP